MIQSILKIVVGLIAIVDERKSGKFKNWADFIKRVKGVGNARANKLSKAGLTINNMPLNK